MMIDRLEELLQLVFQLSVIAVFISILIDKIRLRREQQKKLADAQPKSMRADGKIADKEMTQDRQRARVDGPASSVADFATEKDFEKNEIAQTQFGPEKPLTGGRWRWAQKEQDKKRIGSILVARGLITPDILAQALEHQKRYGGSLTQYLLHYGYINEKQLAQCLCSQFRVPYLPIESYVIPEEIVKLIPTDIVEKYWVLPVEKQGEALTVVMVDPLDTQVIKELEDLTGLTIVPFVGIISEIVSALQVYYKLFVKDQSARVPPFFIDTQTYSGIERRRSIRYEVALEVQFPAQGQYLRSQTIDVSRDGFAFHSNRSVELGAMLTLEVNLPREQSLFPIAAVTQVVRCLPRENNNFEVAVRTLKISKEEIGIIINYAITQNENKKNPDPPPIT